MILTHLARGVLEMNSAVTQGSIEGGMAEEGTAARTPGRGPIPRTQTAT